MYGDRGKVKDNILKTKVDDYFLDEFERLVKAKGDQKQTLLRKWIIEGFERDQAELLEQKTNRYVVDL